MSRPFLLGCCVDFHSPRGGTHQPSDLSPPRQTPTSIIAFASTGTLEALSPAMLMRLSPTM